MSIEIISFDKARAQTLSKWEMIKELARKLFDEMDNRCGFCKYAEGINQAIFSCKDCPAQIECTRINAKMSDIEDMLFEEIDKALSFIKKVKTDEH